MPARTNEFQKIVYHITKHAAAAGATVMESQSLYDEAAGINREVDVVERRSADGKSTLIGIECTKLGEKADVKWVDEMLGKHRDLPTDVLILYSDKGFSKAAIQKAAYYHKTIIAMESLDDEDAERLFGGASTLWLKQAQFTPTKVVIKVLAVGDLPEESFSAFPDTAIYNALQEPLINPKDYVPWLIQQPAVMSEFLKRGELIHKGFLVGAAPPTDIFGNRLYVLKNDVTPNVLRAIDIIEIRGEVEFSNSPLPVKHGRLGKDTVAWGTTDLGEKRLIVVGSKRVNQEMKVSLDTFDIPSKDRTRRRKRTAKRKRKSES